MLQAMMGIITSNSSSAAMFKSVIKIIDSANFQILKCYFLYVDIKVNSTVDVDMDVEVGVVLDNYRIGTGGPIFRRISGKVC